MEEVLREMMARAEKAWREYHEEKKVSSWELSERLEKEKPFKLEADNGLVYIGTYFSPIFRRPGIKVCWWESPASYALILMKLGRMGWELDVMRTGRESECERICLELAMEERR